MHELLDHDADIGIRARGATLADLCASMARGVVELIAEDSSLEAVEARAVDLSAPDAETLVLNWLRELLFWFSTEGFLPVRCDLAEATPTRLRGRVWGERFDPARAHARTGSQSDHPACPRGSAGCRRLDRRGARGHLTMTTTAATHARTWTGPLERLDAYRWRIPVSYQAGMRVPGLIFASEALLADIALDQSLQQVANVAHLPGIVKASMAMPDIHWGYGAPIGGVAAFDLHEGIVSPGLIGYDINCGVRLVRTDLSTAQIQPTVHALIATLFRNVPCGVGMRGDIRLGGQDAERVMAQGAAWAVAHGYGVPEDLAHTESRGCLEGADPAQVSDRARRRGADELGTLGSGNHFMEVQVVERIDDAAAAQALGLFEGQATVMIHSGSRGFGYQICDDYLDVAEAAMARYGITVPDRQLACVPLTSDEGRAYLGAMRCAANYAWANRQCLMHLARATFERVFQRSWEDLGMRLVYDVAHNTAKFERHRVDGREQTLCVHRKGATRAFPPNHPETPAAYQAVGQPVIIPGDMGRHSYVLVGLPSAMEESFGSCCHGAGRVMSRAEAVRRAAGRSITQELAERGIVVMGRGRKGIAEEQPAAYKDVNEVVSVVHHAGLAKPVARLRPLGVIKG
jgi:tRNA-splicing ligase RtcB